jgi:ABC-type transport system substrate-binding protein
MAIDKQLIATAIFAGSAKAASQLVVPGMLGYDDTVIEFYRYDASAAKRQLADAGLASGFATEIWYPASWRPYYPEPRRVAESIAADLAKIGVAAAIRTEDPAAFLADVRADRLPLFLGDAGGDSGDPDASFSDVGTWLNDIARELLARARGETDATKRTELYKQVSKLVLQDAARVPLVHSDALVAATRKIHGLRPHPIGVEVYTTVWSGR